MPARFDSLRDWLRWQETLHPREIELGLERIAKVFARLHPRPPACPVITIAGTNGKGSSLRMLESIYRAGGYRTGAYSSPHLLRYNERICLDGEPVADGEIVSAFARIDAARGDISLTYFEFGTLAALDIFLRAEPQVILLETGLGGRLDAVNIIDADVALITAIGLDHTEWLGEDREAIGFEKAGILRPQRPAVCSDPDAPRSLRQHAAALDCSLHCLGEEFDFSLQPGGWRWKKKAAAALDLPPPALPGRHQYRNAAGVLMVLDLLQARLPVSREAIRRGLLEVRLPGRFQQVPGREGARWIYDVAHNPDSVAMLAQMLEEEGGRGCTRALLGMLADKDSAAALAGIYPQIDEWHLVPLDCPRARAPEELAEILAGLGDARIRVHASMAQAYRALDEAAGAGDRNLVFGSFYTVSGAMAVARQHGQRI